MYLLIYISHHLESLRQEIFWNQSFSTHTSQVITEIYSDSENREKNISQLTNALIAS